MAEQEKAKLSTVLGAYVTILGYSWGMSDIWRFPFLAYRNGGGAFLIPFVITILFCGIPLFYIEFGAGKFSGKGIHEIWDISPIFRGVGLAVFIVYICYMLASTVFRGWMFQFTWYAYKDPLPWSTCSNSWNTPTCRVAQYVDTTSETGDSNITIHSIANVTLEMTSNIMNISASKAGLTAAEEFWQYNILELSPGLTEVYPFQWRYVAFTFVWRAILMVVAIFGIQGVEKVMYVTTTLPILTSVAMLVRSLMLPGAIDGLYHFFYPDLERLLDLKIWVEAFVMGFYTLGFGWGCITYLGSRSEFKDSSSRVAIICPILDAAMAIFQGMVCFSVLGNMAASHGVDVKDVIEANISTGIVAYVTALASLPFPQLWSLTFFISVTLSGLDSQLIPFVMLVQLFGEMCPGIFYKRRVHTVVVLSLVLFLFGLPTCTGAGAYMFLFIDWYSGAWSGPIIALVEVFVIGWTYGLDRWSDDVKLMSGRAISFFMHVGIGFTTPLVVIVIFMVGIAKYIPPVYGSYTYPILARVLGWTSVAIVILPIIIQAIKCITQEKGSLLQKIKRSVAPNSNWGPADTEVGLQYNKLAQTYKTRGYKELVLYNFTRRRRAHSTIEPTIPEMTELI